MVSPLVKQIIPIIKDNANNNPAPLKCIITKTYPDSNYADIRLTDTGDVLNYVEVIGENKIGVTGLLVFVNGENNNNIIITGGADGGGGDLSNYYTKTQINEILSSYVTSSYLNTNYAKIEHTHSISQVSELQTQLNGKANLNHNHAISDVTDLQNELNSLDSKIASKQDKGDCVTSIELVPKSEDATGAIRLYYGDEQ